MTTNKANKVSKTTTAKTAAKPAVKPAAKPAAKTTAARKIRIIRITTAITRSSRLLQIPG